MGSSLEGGVEKPLSRSQVLPRKPHFRASKEKPAGKRPFETKSPFDLVGQSGEFPYNGKRVPAVVLESTRRRMDAKIDVKLTLTSGKETVLKGVEARKFKITVATTE